MQKQYLHPKAPQMLANQCACWQASGLHGDSALCLCRTWACKMGHLEPNVASWGIYLKYNSKHCSLANVPSQACRKTTKMGLTIR